MGNTVIQLRNDTAANWASGNPVLAVGEMGLETDTNRIKFGDGTTVWNSLSYFRGGSFKYGLYSLSADQSSNLSVENHIEFNNVQGSLPAPSTGSGQANGIITLPAGRTYKISGAFQTNHSAAGLAQIQIYNRTSSSYIGFMTASVSMNYNTPNAMQPTLLAIITPSTNIDIDARINGAINLSIIQSELTWLLIEEYGGY
jgi:hypothetical protein